MWDVTGKPEYKDHAERWFKVQKRRMKVNSDGACVIWNYWQPAGPWDYKADGTPKHWVGVHPNGGYYDYDVQIIVEACEHSVVFNQEDIVHLIAAAKTSWQENDPSSNVPGFTPLAGMEISVEPAGGTAKAVNACFPNSKTAEPASAGPGALSGTVVSVTWDAKANKGKIVVQPKGAQSAQVTVATDKDTKVQMLRMWPALAPYDTDIQKQFEAIQRPDDWFSEVSVPYYLMLQSKLAGK